MRFFTRALSGLFLLAITIGLLAVAGGLLRGALQDRAAREVPAREAREQVFAAPVTTLDPETIEPILDAFGQIASRRTLEVRAGVGGRIVEMGENVQEGGRVDQGQLLFQIDPREADRALAVRAADLQDAEAALEDAVRAADLSDEDVENARAQLALRQSAAERLRDLEGRGVGSTQALETAELAVVAAEQSLLTRRQSRADADAAVAQARTALERARIALSEAERVRDDTEIRAAFDGILGDVTLVEGGLVSQNEQLATLIDPDALEVGFRVSAGDYARLLDDAGNLTTRDVTVMLEAGGYTLASPATITRESAQVGEGQTGRQIFAQLANPQGFRDGDFVAAGVEEPALSGVTRLPAGAVDATGGVLILGPDDRLVAEAVEIVRRQGDDVLVRPGDLSGREVVTQRSPTLGAGIKVRPQREPAAPEAAGVSSDFLELSDERRARLVAFVEGSERMPQDAKARVLAQLREARVPAGVVARIEGRMGG